MPNLVIKQGHPDTIHDVSTNLKKTPILYMDPLLLFFLRNNIRLDSY